MPVDANQKRFHQQILHGIGQKSLVFFFQGDPAENFFHLLCITLDVENIGESGGTVGQQGKKPLADLVADRELRSDVKHITPVVFAAGGNGVLLKPAENHQISRLGGVVSVAHTDTGGTGSDVYDLVTVVVMGGLVGTLMGITG